MSIHVHRQVTLGFSHTEPTLFILDEAYELDFTQVLVLVGRRELDPDEPEEFVLVIRVADPLIPAWSDFITFHCVDKGEGGVVIAAFHHSGIEVFDVTIHGREQLYLGQVGLHVQSEVKHQLVLVASVVLFKQAVHQVINI